MVEDEPFTKHANDMIAVQEEMGEYKEITIRHNRSCTCFS